MTYMIRCHRASLVSLDISMVLDTLSDDPDDSVMLKDFYKYVADDADAYVYLATDDGIIVGWALDYEPPGEKFCVFQVYVMEGFRRRGIGTVLFNAVAISAKGRTIHPLEHDAQSRAFFKKLLNTSGETND